MYNLQITETYKSIQGEARFTGRPCVFVRLTGCPLRCKWCDTAYGFEGGKNYTRTEVLDEIAHFDTRLVELTGGEPLAQAGAIPLMQDLVAAKYQVMIETGGSISIADIPKPVHVIMDVKCPDSQMAKHNLYANFAYLKPSDEIKLVVASKDDFDWGLNLIEQHSLESKANILFSPAWGLVKPKDLTEWILASGKNIRLNLQLHKYIWSPRAKGV